MSVQAIAEQREYEQERRFARTLVSRRIAATWALIGANIAVFALMVLEAGTLDANTTAYSSVLVNFGGQVNFLIAQGEVWRLITPIFIHIGLLHLTVNMYSLYILGQAVERIYGTARFIVLYVLSGLAGSLCHYYFNQTASVAAGASGAIFGLMGILFVFGILYRNELPGGFRRAFSPVQILPILLLNIYITFTFANIGKEAHLGGLGGGAILALLIPYARVTERKARTVWRLAAGLCVVACIAGFAGAISTPKRSASEIDALFSKDTPSSRLVDAYNQGITTFDKLKRVLHEAHADDVERARVITEARSAAALAHRAEGLDDRSHALLERQSDLLERGAELATAAQSAKRPDAVEVSDWVGEVDDLQRDWRTWLVEEGERNGITQKKTDENGG